MNGYRATLFPKFNSTNCDSESNCQAYIDNSWLFQDEDRQKLKVVKVKNGHIEKAYQVRELW